MFDRLMVGFPGGAEWIVILVIALLIFGPRLPQVMRSLGKGITEFKKGIRDVEDDVKTEIDTAAGEKRLGIDDQDELKG